VQLGQNPFNARPPSSNQKRYNTALSSIATVESLFSATKLVLTARKNRLSDQLLEYSLLLKMHKK
jgi:hypothetical protein